jgi:hypothetical protein
MSFEAMVVMIVLITAIASVVRAKHGVIRTGRGKEEMYVGPQRDSAEADQLRGEVRQLKDRIAVLERIVTDGDRNRGLNLEREIEALRIERETR